MSRQWFRNHFHRAPEWTADIDAAKLPEKSAGNAPTHDEIARLAYSYWEARGGRGGSALEDWLRAERALKGQAG